MKLLIHHTIAHPIVGVLHVAADALDLVRGAAMRASLFLTGVAEVLHDVTAPDKDDDEDDEATGSAESAMPADAHTVIRCPDCQELLGYLGGEPFTRAEERDARAELASAHRGDCKKRKAS